MLDLGYVGRKVISPMFSNILKQGLEPKKTELIQFLLNDSDIFRVYPVDNWTTNEFGWFRIASIGGYHAAKMANYQDCISDNMFNNINFLKLSNTKYTISSQHIDHPEFVHKESFDGKHIYMLKNWLPRVFLVDSVIYLKDKAETLNLIKSSQFNPGRNAILTRNLSNQHLNSSGSEVEIDSWAPEIIQISVKVQDTCLLALSEGYYPPGWNAYIDGNETEIFQTNHFMQSIVVPTGDHKVEFRFALPSFNRALIISRIIFIAVLVILISYCIWINRQRLKLI